MADHLLTFDPDDTSDRTFVVTEPVRYIVVAGASAFYRATDPTFAGAIFAGGADLFGLLNPGLAVGDVLTIRLGGPGDGPLGGYNGGGSCPSSAPAHYGLGGGGCTEILRNGSLWSVAGGGFGGFRYEVELGVFDGGSQIDPGVLAWVGGGSRRRLPGMPPPDADEQPRVPYAIELEDFSEYVYNPEQQAGGATGGVHDGADGVLNNVYTGEFALAYQYSTGAGGGGYGGGSSGSAAIMVLDPPDAGPEPGYWLWNIGKPGGSLVPVPPDDDLSEIGLPFPDLDDVTLGHGWVLIRTGQYRGWSVGRIRM